ncbi:MAG TPA: cupin domain-containing protein [Gammaproteobacteria bacterium]|nr:cupin domain-containing protein [Gammaproteobacteria bacterium]
MREETLKEYPSVPEEAALAEALEAPRLAVHRLADDGTYPNNPRLPLLVYRDAFRFPEAGDPAALIEQVFSANGWPAAWRNGVFAFHHYHSTAHEVLGVYGGRARVLFGGPDGIEVEAERGDVVVLPAGTAHKRLQASPDFAVVGAYPSGQQHDMQYGETGERPETDRRIRKVPVPASDPVYGRNGPLAELWRERPRLD